MLKEIIEIMTLVSRGPKKF